MKKIGLLLTSFVMLTLALFSLVFFKSSESTIEQPTLELKPMINGGASYNFSDGTFGPDKRLYIKVKANWSDSQCNTSDNVSLNVGYVEIYICKGASFYNDTEQDEVGNGTKSSVSFNGNEIGNYGETLSLWSGYVSEGKYDINAKVHLWSGNIFAANNHEYYLNYTFYVDWTSPCLNLENVVNGGLTNKTVKCNTTTSYVGAGSQWKCWNGDNVRIYYSRNNLGSGIPSSASSTYTSGTSLSADGHYRVNIIDGAGNQNNYTFTIDRTKPQNNFNYTLNNNKYYTSENIVFNPTDNYALNKSYVKFGSGPWVSSQSEADSAGYKLTYNGNRVTVSNENQNGEWYFKASDTAGNYSDEQCVVMNVVKTYGNQNSICHSYKTNTWYNVVLPSNIYGIEGRNIAGTYSAPTYDIALRFAKAKEYEYRVTEIPTGWMYVNAGNGNLTQLYTSYDELDKVVEKYADSYIKERSVAKNGENSFGKIINAELYLDSTALTRQFSKRPSWLGGDLPLYFIRPTFKFVDPGLPYETFVKVQMVANDYGLVSRDPVQLNYDQTIASQVLETGNNSQGYYLVTEWDNAGNNESYYVYLDVSAPTLTANATYGDNTNEIIVFDESMVEQYDGTLRYLSLDLRLIADSIDDYVVMKISGRKLSDATYVQFDELPILDGIDYYGNYQIELYDRSGNTLSFTVSIAGEAPSMSHTSLTSDVSCRLTLNISDSTNAIMDIKLYYITYEGTYVELPEDHNGTTVNVATLQYTILTGGKYTIWYRDLYGRTEYCPYVFYLKGLPTGTLSGVVDGGITNKNVSLKYSAGNSVILYKIENNVKTVVALDGIIFGQTYDETSRRYTATLMANEETSASYVFFLY